MSLLKARTEECHLLSDVKVFLGNLCSLFFQFEIGEKGEKEKKGGERIENDA